MNSDLVFHHLGVATRDIEKCVGTYVRLGYTASEIRTEPSQNVRICFLSKEGSPSMELVEPFNDDSPVSRMVKQSGTTPYHTCYEVNDINATIEELEEMNFRLLFEPIRSEAMEDGWFCYLFSPETGLIELYQRIREDS